MLRVRPRLQQLHPAVETSMVMVGAVTGTSSDVRAERTLTNPTWERDVCKKRYCTLTMEIAVEIFSVSSARLPTFRSCIYSSSSPEIRPSAHQLTWISSVMCGTTCTVLPRYSPLRSLRMTDW